MNSIAKSIRYYSDSFFILFGFNDSLDFFESSFHFSYIAMKPLVIFVLIMLSTIVSFILSFVQTHLGIGASFFSIFFVLLLLEFFTGIIASSRKGEELTSKKGVRFLIKTGVYMILIMLFHDFYEELYSHQDAESKVYMFMMRNAYYFILINVVIWTVISVDENLKKGWNIDLKITSKIKDLLKIFNSKNDTINNEDNKS